MGRGGLGYSPRINEVLGLETNCVRWIADRSGRRRLRIASPGSKLKPTVVRYVATDMTDAVQEALERITAVTAEARRIKAWYDRHDGVLYLPPHLEHLRGRTDLNHAEAGVLLGMKPRGAQRKMSALLGLQGAAKPGTLRAARTWRFNEVEDLILQRLPRSRLVGEHLRLLPLRPGATAKNPADVRMPGWRYLDDTGLLQVSSRVHRALVLDDAMADMAKAG